MWSTAAAQEALASYGIPVPAGGFSVAVAGMVLLVAFLVQVLAHPRMDPREPQLVKSRIPFVGHIIGLLRHQATYHVILQ